jgi:hypothetical protein
MEQLYACGIALAAVTTMVGIFISGYGLGKIDGKPVGEFEMRPKVVVYCIEKPQLCKEEYDSIKTQEKLNNYQLPEIK